MTTLLLSQQDVAHLLTVDEALEAIEEVFRAHAAGGIELPPLVHANVSKGEFHIKAGGYRSGHLPYFTTKINGGFFANGADHGLPSILGLIVLNHTESGFPLAVMDSSILTALRTAAAMGVAAKYLADPDSRVATLCGCGKQAAWQLRALKAVMPKIQTVFVYSRHFEKSALFSEKMSQELKIEILPINNLLTALKQSQICITCTSSKNSIIDKSMLPSDIFIAAMGADSPDKQEIDPYLFKEATVITDIYEQCAKVGDLHHALKLELIDANKIFELGQVVTNQVNLKRKSGVIIFDSTGTAMQDVALASLAYEKAKQTRKGLHFDFFK